MILRYFLLFLFCLFANPLKASSPLFLGVYAYQKPESVKQQYQGLVDYLSSKLPNHHIQLKVLDATQMRAAVRNQQIHMAFMNPNLYELVRTDTALRGVMATVQMYRNGIETDRLGGVIFGLKSTQNKPALQDLVHQPIAVPTFNNTGAFRVPLYELIKAGVNQKDLVFMAVGDNDSVVEKVLAGQAKFGFVRTGILEDWQLKKGLDLTQFDIVNPKHSVNFPYLLSTRLYPEWPFVVMPSLDHDLARDIAVALFSLRKHHPAAKQARIAGFSAPQDYLPFENLLRELRLPPYEAPVEPTLLEVWQTYKWTIIALFLMGVTMVVAYVKSERLRAQIHQKTQSLDDIIEGTRAITWEWQVKTGKTQFNERWANIVGYDLKELEPTSIVTWQNFIHPDDALMSAKKLKEHFDGETEWYECEVRMRHKLGHWVWVLDRGKVVERDAKGHPVKMAGTHTDITALKENAAALNLKSQRDSVLLNLPSVMERYSEKEFMQLALAELEKLTESEISFIHFIHADNNQIELAAWSKRTLEKYCHLDKYQTHYAIDEAGVWAEAARESRPVVINDYANDERKKGMPKGHAELSRMISLPVVESEQVVMLAGVGNKQELYTLEDVETTQLITNEIWRLIKSRRNQEKIANQKQQFERLVNDLGEEYVVFSHSGKRGILRYVSKNAESIFGVKAEALIGQPWYKSNDWAKESIRLAWQMGAKILSGEEQKNQFMLTEIHQDIEEKVILVQQHGVYDTDGKLVTIDGLMTDITDRVKAEKGLKQAANVFTYAQEGILICNARNEIMSVNQRFTDITGYTASEVMGKNPSFLSSGRQGKDFYQALWQCLQDEGVWSGEIWNRKKNGEIYPEKLTISTIKSSAGVIEQYIALFADISFEKDQQAQLEKMAHFDPLTGLPNRALLSDRLTHAMAFNARHGNMVAVIFIDLDGFKQVNDEFGHQAGDYLLEVIAKRFHQVIRAEDTVARVGGDEFVVVMGDSHSKDQINHVLERLLSEASKAIYYEGHQLQVSSSIGVVLYDQKTQGELGSEQLLRQADQAMYEAKNAGKNQVRFFEGLKEDVSAFNEFCTEVEAGLANKEFVLFFQPKVCFRTAEVTSMEALIRWQHPEKGLLAPVHFLPKLEGHPLSLQVGDWVLEQALHHMEAWKALGVNVHVSVNIDGFQIEQANFISNLRMHLEKHHHVEPNELTLELLESSALEDIDYISNRILEARKMGVGFAIDDFGTGYASLNYLKSLPVNELKIDQVFVRELLEQPQSLSIIEAIRAMADAFQMSVVAEGAETDEHIEILLSLGVELVQGYAVSRPMPADEVAEWVAKWDVEEEYAQIKELNTDGVSILKARLEHKAWMAQVVHYVYSEGEKPDLNSPIECGFGQWLYSRGQQIYADSPEKFAQIEMLHEEVHVTARKLVSLKDVGEMALAEQGVKHLKKLKKELFELVD